MRFHFHRWEAVFRHEIESGRGWFEERCCRKCGKTKIVDTLNFFSNFDDAIALGIALGLYTGLRKYYELGEIDFATRL